MDILTLAKNSNFDGKPSLHPERKGQLNLSPLKNWIEKRGGLPTYINSIATALFREKYPGWSISRIIATAVNMVKKMCATGKAMGGRISVSAAVKAAACKAVAQWEAKKASASETIDVDILELTDYDEILMAHAKRRVELREAEKNIPEYLELTDREYLEQQYEVELTEEEWEQVEVDTTELIDSLVA